MPSERLVIKVGTNVLTQPNLQLDYNVIHHMVDQIGRLRAAGHLVVLVTSGAAGAARGLVDFSREKSPLVRRQMLCAVGQSRLMQIYADFFREQNIIPAQALLARSDFASREHYLNIRNVMEGLLQNGMLPIINENDVVATDALTFGDNDYLAAGVASMIGADRLFILSTARGFFLGGDPALNQDARLVEQVEQITPEIRASCEATLSSGGRGGMLSKLKAVEMAASFGIQAHIVYGKEPDVVPRIMAGESIGTCFLPTAKRLKSYHQWLRFGPLVGGRVMVDSGARKALGNNKSLLTAGISGVDGGFGKGEIVDIFSQDEEKLGVGLVNYSAEDLRDIIAQKNSADRPPKSAESKEVEAIHKDRMVLVNGG